jgi:hypothetical protein
MKNRALVVVVLTIEGINCRPLVNHEALRMPACLLALVSRSRSTAEAGWLVIAVFTTRLCSSRINHPIAFKLPYTEKMPHFPQPSQEVSETMILPTRERESERNDNSRRPSTNDDNNTQRTSRLRVQNRRRRYLELNPEYLSGSNLEQAGL